MGGGGERKKTENTTESFEVGDVLTTTTSMAGDRRNGDHGDNTTTRGKLGYRMGRPDLLDACAAAAARASSQQEARPFAEVEVGVYVCGPGSLGASVDRACSMVETSSEGAGCVFHLHREVFTL